MTLRLTSRVHEVEDLDAFIELAYAESWTDGLPVYPPTDERVEAMLAHLGRDPAEVIGVMPRQNRRGTFTLARWWRARVT